jgi:hypothetical protein
MSDGDMQMDPIVHDSSRSLREKYYNYNVQLLTASVKIKITQQGQTCFQSINSVRLS